MFTVDDDAPSHVDRSDDPMMSPQVRRALRLQSGRTTAQGLNDRILTPHHRAPSAMQSVPMNPRQQDPVTAELVESAAGHAYIFAEDHSGYKLLRHCTNRNEHWKHLSSTVCI